MYTHAMIAIVTILTACAIPVSDAAKKGQVFPVPEWQWVKVVSEVKNLNVKLKPGERCGIQEGGHAKVLGVEGQMALVEYQLPFETAGTPCPSGTMFLIETRKLDAWPDEFQARQDAADKEQSLIQRLLKQR